MRFDLQHPNVCIHSRYRWDQEAAKNDTPDFQPSAQPTTQPKYLRFKILVEIDCSYRLSYFGIIELLFWGVDLHFVARLKGRFQMLLTPADSHNSSH